MPHLQSSHRCPQHYLEPIQFPILIQQLTLVTNTAPRHIHSRQFLEMLRTICVGIRSKITKNILHHLMIVSSRVRTCSTSTHPDVSEHTILFYRFCVCVVVCARVCVLM